MDVTNWQSRSWPIRNNQVKFIEYLNFSEHQQAMQNGVKCCEDRSNITLLNFSCSVDFNNFQSLFVYFILNIDAHVLLKEVFYSVIAANLQLVIIIVQYGLFMVDFGMFMATVKDPSKEEINLVRKKSGRNL